MKREKRSDERRKHGFYMRVTDNNTHELLGYVTDISLRGFKLDTPRILEVKKDYALRLEYTSEVLEKPFIVFIARAKWSQLDPITPNEYIVGFQIVSISPSEQEIYKGIVENYGLFEHKW
jgi:hypothetical protein